MRTFETIVLVLIALAASACGPGIADPQPIVQPAVTVIVIAQPTQSVIEQPTQPAQIAPVIVPTQTPIVLQPTPEPTWTPFYLLATNPPPQPTQTPVYVWFYRSLHKERNLKMSNPYPILETRLSQGYAVEFSMGDDRWFYLTATHPTKGKVEAAGETIANAVIMLESRMKDREAVEHVNAADGGYASANKQSSVPVSEGYVKCFVCGRQSMKNDVCQECGYGTPLWQD